MIMKQDLLETIIKNVLFEQRTVAKIRNASAKMTALARSVGAVHAYSVLVKGTSNPRDIQDLVEAATIGSKGGDGETIAVGRQSKFADGNYMYVCSTPESDKRQLINVWIVPVSVIQGLPDHAQPLGGEDVAKQGFTKIGTSIMLTKSQLSVFKDINGTNFDTLKGEVTGLATPADTKTDDKKDVDTKTDDKKDDVKKDDNTEWLNKNETKNVTFPYTWHTFDKRNNPIQLTVFEAVVLDGKTYLYTKINEEWLVIKQPERFISTIEKEQADPDSVSWNELWDGIDLTPADRSKLDAILEAISLNRYMPSMNGKIEYILSPKIYGYPFESHGDAAGYWQPGKLFDTLSDSDPYVYMIDDPNTPTHYMLKSDFESNYADYKKLNALLQPLTDQSVINKVKKHMEDWYNSITEPESTETKPNTTTTVKPKPPVKTDPNKTKIIKLNTEKTESRNGIVFINLSKTPVYNYKNKKWVKVGDYDPKDGQYIAYLGNSSDYKYVRVKFAKDQVTAWVPTSAVK